MGGNAPVCQKCDNPLQSNNEFTCHNGNRVCGSCWKEYQEHIEQFFK